MSHSGCLLLDVTPLVRLCLALSSSPPLGSSWHWFYFEFVLVTISGISCNQAVLTPLDEHQAKQHLGLK